MTLEPIQGAYGDMPKIDDRFAMEKYRVGWFAFRGRIQAAAAEREGYTGLNPIVAERPALDTPPAIFRKRHDEKK